MAKRKMSLFERLRKGLRLTQQQREDVRKRWQSADPGLSIVHADAAGIDVGSKSHFVAVPAGRDEQPVREFDRGQRT